MTRLAARTRGLETLRTRTGDLDFAPVNPAMATPTDLSPMTLTRTLSTTNIKSDPSCSARVAIGDPPNVDPSRLTRTVTEQ